MNRLIFGSEIESVILGNFPTNKCPGPDGSIGEFYQTLKKKTYINPSQILPKDLRGRNAPQIILCCHHHPDTQTRQRH